MSDPWNLVNDTTNGQTGSSTAADHRSQKLRANRQLPRYKSANMLATSRESYGETAIVESGLKVTATSKPFFVPRAKRPVCIPLLFFLLFTCIVLFIVATVYGE